MKFKIRQETKPDGKTVFLIDRKVLGLFWSEVWFGDLACYRAEWSSLKYALAWCTYHSNRGKYDMDALKAGPDIVVKDFELGKEFKLG